MVSDLIQIMWLGIRVVLVVILLMLVGGGIGLLTAWLVPDIVMAIVSSVAGVLILFFVVGVIAQTLRDVGR